MADIKGMFHQVRLPDTDPDLLRFLWWPNGNLDKNLEEFQMMVHLFGAVSSPSCANFALRKTAEDNKEKFNPEVINTVHKNFYVDDCLKSVPTIVTAIKLTQDLQCLLNKGGFRLTKWISNNREVLQSIPETERAKGVSNIDFEYDYLPVERALGVTWHVEMDTIGFKVADKDRPLTRRGMLSVISSIYDPLGIATPFTLTAKIILQDLTRLKLEWDAVIPSVYLARWQRWLYDLSRLPDFSVNRCIKPQDFGTASHEMHHFSDASQAAYGTVSYLRTTNPQGQVYCSLLFGKSRLAPLKQMSIPRLELAAAALSIRSDRMLRRELEIPVESSTFWTDSMTVIQYIENNNRRFHTYVANRVTFIRNSSSPDQWNYIETRANPADVCSRGMTIEDFLSCETWKTGPEVLWKQEIIKSIRPDSQKDSLQGDPEVKSDAIIFTTTAHKASDPVEAIFRRFSTYLRLKKFIAMCLRCQRKFRERKSDCIVHTQKIERIDVQDLQDAEQEILKYVQRQAFPEELSTLTHQKNIKKSSHILKLDPILTDGLLRVGGRLGKSTISYDAKHQIIIPKNSYIAHLIIAHFHYKSGHSGREHVLALVRQQYWILRANVAVRKVLASCFDCRRRQAAPSEQKMSDLPKARITPDKPPFTCTGVDYFGPFLVRLKRSLVKRYGVMFTCLAVRAVHIEVSSTLETDSFILALRRFIARRGQVKEMYSDNGTNLVGGERELREAILRWNQVQIHELLLQKEIKWFFNPPAASHHGGSWERCIRTTRKILSALMKEQHLDDEGLITLMTEVEAIINGRPLTKASADPRDEQPLTPNHLLLLNQEPSLPPGIFDKYDIYSKRRWRQVQYMADLFWRRWTTEYLPLLQQRVKWNYPSRNLAKDDIVLVIDASSPRNSWLIGRIIQVYPDSKGLIRRVQVKTKTGTFERPITKLCLLEACL